MNQSLAAPRALIADDEPLLRERLERLLAELWPELQVVGVARNGREAVALFEAERPEIAFLDIRMPGLSGIEAARAIGSDALIVFITAYDEHAVQAFEQGAADYLVKPFDEPRLAETVRRLQQRLHERSAGARLASASEPGGEQPFDGLLDQLAARLRASGVTAGPGGPWLQWIRASVGPAVKLIPVEQVSYLRSDEKYTLVVWDGGEALIRRTIRELAEELDPQRFVQVHRSVIVNLHRVVQVLRGPNDTAEVQLKDRSELLPVSRSYLHLFRQM
ncbi:LytR/AlgR family response regulator transcription factor [Rivibacter subsaxonicus]|uniref:LytTR family two component transcriptional regulator n=1 Tax=Rivibacter subsaxonicus TaxID=457575 RepID=A0A4Q7W205_9BURK|nr:LytTR family DNA-binding domain-containing protein [Rivibacter subsaxonicus]RZU03113.1 LytTR family two component transcriptional regulator [Rivibacter subsaxonicus]